jgi:hypothetical protein
MTRTRVGCRRADPLTAVAIFAIGYETVKQTRLFCAEFHIDTITDVNNVTNGGKKA